MFGTVDELNGVGMDDVITCHNTTCRIERKALVWFGRELIGGNEGKVPLSDCGSCDWLLNERYKD